jgi:hypothetical protein
VLKEKRRAEEAELLIEENDLAPRSLVDRLLSATISDSDISYKRGDLRSSRAVTATEG